MSEPAKPASHFAAKMKELEQIVSSFEEAEIDLEAALPKFKRGMELAAELKQELEQFTNQVQVIKQKFEIPPETKAEE